MGKILLKKYVILKNVNYIIFSKPLFRLHLNKFEYTIGIWQYIVYIIDNKLRTIFK